MKNQFSINYLSTIYQWSLSWSLSYETSIASEPPSPVNHRNFPFQTALFRTHRPLLDWDTTILHSIIPFLVPPTDMAMDMKSWNPLMIISAAATVWIPIEKSLFDGEKLSQSPYSSFRSYRVWYDRIILNASATSDPSSFYQLLPTPIQPLQKLIETLEYYNGVECLTCNESGRKRERLSMIIDDWGGHGWVQGWYHMDITSMPIRADCFR